MWITTTAKNPLNLILFHILHAFYPCISRAVLCPECACSLEWLCSSFGFFFIPYCDLVTLVRRFRKASEWLIQHIPLPYHTEYLTQFPRSSDGLWRMWQCGRKFVKRYYRVYKGLPLEPILSQTKSIHALIRCLLKNHCRWVSNGVKSDC